ncbi:MAG: aminotransferase class I/II-fold pyridoxal phosphate-dependent enzyme, partial [Devosia nanyangense]|nr:aminotransferase class I/II-fold pyridoxal phosphate-dependent enzyme [Devosia nanyangense]
ALGRHWDVAPDLVILGNGSNELLELAGRCFLLPGDEAVYAEQAFIVYDLVAQVTGAAKVSVPLRDFTHDLDAIRRTISPRTKLVFIGNPNNPTRTDWASSTSPQPSGRPSRKKGPPMAQPPTPMRGTERPSGRAMSVPEWRVALSSVTFILRSS